MSNALADLSNGRCQTVRMPAHRPLPSVLEGRYIRLVPLSAADLPELYPAIGAAEVFEGGYGGGPAGHPDSRDAFIEFATGYYDFDERNVYGARLVGGEHDGLLVGVSTLGDFDEPNEQAHIGWTAWDPRVWGTAVNPEAKLLMLGVAFDHGFGRVKLQADALNSRSRSAISKLGASFEGILRRDRPRADGTWRDTAVFSVLVDEWPAVRAGLQARLDAFEGAPVTLSGRLNA